MSVFADPVSDAHSEILTPYVPRLLIEWMREAPGTRYRAIDGSLAFVDISGFTALTERLAKQGKIGAELMRDTLDGVFTALLDEAYDWGAGLLKWGGDALLLFFDGPLHAERAARAAWEMQRTIGRVGRLRVSGGTVVLRMSIGVTTGTFEFFAAGSIHRELLIAGPGATETVTIEAIADAGEIGISRGLAAVLAPSCVGPAKGEALLLAAPPDVERKRAPDVGSVSGIDIASCIPVAARAHVLLDRSEPEHRTITAAFIDLMNTDDLLARLGAEAFADALDERICSLQEAALRFDVPFYETDVGKGSVKALLTAGAPSSTGHDEERMLRVLREIVERPGVVPMRIGVNTGKVFTGDFGPPYRRAYRVFGDAINTAARVMSKAEAGQILSTEIVLERSRTIFVTTPIEPFQAKGKAELVRASIVGPVAGMRTDRRARVPLVGREAELDALLQVIDEVRAGRGWVIDLAGAPGIGKSRLVEELIEHADARDVVVLHARCEEYESSTPYFALRAPVRTVLGLEPEADSDEVERRLREVVGRVDPALAPWIPLLALLLGLDLPSTPETRSLDPRFIRDQLAETSMRLLVSSLAGTATMLVVEDVHFIDEASADLLERLSRAGLALRQALLVTHSQPGTTWAQPDDDELRCLSLCLLPLPSRRMAELVELLTDEDPLSPHETEEIARRSGGNALFLFELVEAVRATGTVDSLPDSVESLIAGEIDRLSPTDRTVLRYASVLGASFDPALLVAAVSEEVEVSEGFWSRLGELVSPEAGGMMRFRSTLIRDAAYEGLPYRRRRVLHERVGRTIESRAGISLEEEVGTLALHFYEAQRYDKAWGYCRQAGDRAMEIYANVDAARFYERAVSAGRRLRHVSATELAVVLEGLGEARYRLGDFHRAAAAFRRARASFGRQSPDASRIIAKEAKLHERLGRYPAALRLLRRGLNALEGDGEAASAGHRADLCGWYAGVRFRQSRYREALEWCVRAEREALEGRSQEALAHAYFIHDVALLMLGDTSMPHYHETLAIYERLGNVREQGNLLNNMGNVAYEESRWSESLELYERARTMLNTIGDRWSASFATYNIAEILSDQGRYEDAEPLLRDVLRVWRASGSRSEVADATRQLGRLMARRGSYAEGRELLEAARSEQLAGGEPGEVIATDARIAECLLYTGEAEAALSLSLDSLARSRTTEGADRVAPMLQRVRGWSLLQAGRLDEAERALATALELARARDAMLEVAFVLEAMIELGRRRGEIVVTLQDEREALLIELGVVHTPAVPLEPGRTALPWRSARARPAAGGEIASPAAESSSHRC